MHTNILLPFEIRGHATELRNRWETGHPECRKTFYGTLAFTAPYPQCICTCIEAGTKSSEAYNSLNPYVPTFYTWRNVGNSQHTFRKSTAEGLAYPLEIQKNQLSKTFSSARYTFDTKTNYEPALRGAMKAHRAYRHRKKWRLAGYPGLLALGSCHRNIHSDGRISLTKAAPCNATAVKG